MEPVLWSRKLLLHAECKANLIQLHACTLNQNEIRNLLDLFVLWCQWLLDKSLEYVRLSKKWVNVKKIFSYCDISGTVSGKLTADRMLLSFIYSLFNLFLFFLSSLEDMLIDLREEGREGDQEGNINAREKHLSIASHTPSNRGPLVRAPVGDWTCKVGMEPWLGIKPVTFSIYGELQPSEPHQQRHSFILFRWYLVILHLFLFPSILLLSHFSLCSPPPPLQYTHTTCTYSHKYIPLWKPIHGHVRLPTIFWHAPPNLPPRFYFSQFSVDVHSCSYSSFSLLPCARIQDTGTCFTLLLFTPYAA